MSMISRNITEELVHAYVDSQLSPDEHIRFERIMENDKELQEKVNDYQMQNQMMHEFFDPVLDEPIPSVLTKSPTEPKKASRFFSLVASFTLLAVGALSGWMANEKIISDFNVQNNSTYKVSSLAQTATVAHAVYTPEVKHPVEVDSSQEKHLVKWLSKRMGKDIAAPNLNSLGYSLMGGRLLPSETGPAAQFMYENKTGNRLTLYVQNSTEKQQDTAFRYFKENGANAFYWIDGELGYAIVGDVSRNELLSSANSVYQQLSL